MTGLARGGGDAAPRLPADCSNFMKQHWLFPFSLVVTILVFHVCYGLEILIPTNVSWLLTAMHDWGTHYLGWYFYRGEDWGFPLGKVSNYFYPIGTNVGFTDSIPLLALFFKLFAPVLPEDFQYFGWWLLLCHLLAAYFTIRLCRLLRVPDGYAFAAVLLVVSNPVLVYRGFHPALCAQWLLIASVYLYLLRPAQVTPARILGYQLLLLLVSALVNPYLCLMVFGCSFFTALKLFFVEKAGKKWHFFTYVGASGAALLLVWYVVGMVTFGGSKEDFGVSGAYGLYSLNLNVLYNPSGFSSLLRGQNLVSWHQYEGYAYLGMGVFILLAASAGYLAYGRLNRQPGGGRQPFKAYFNGAPLLPAAVLLVLLTLFSLTHIVSINDKVLFQVPLPTSIVRLGEIFRASARFFWLPYYLLLLFPVVVIARSTLRPALKTGLLGLAVAVQLYDIFPLLTHRKLTYGAYQPPIRATYWTTLMEGFDEVVFYPPFRATYRTDLDYQYFAFLAARARKPINIGYVARADNNAIALNSERLNKDLTADLVSPRKLYITTGEHLKNFAYLLFDEAVQVSTLDGYYYLFGSTVTGKSVLEVASASTKSNRARLDSALASLGTRPVFRETSRITASGQDVIRYNLETFSNHNKLLTVNGWAFLANTDDNRGDSTFLFLNSDRKSYLLPAKRVARPDVTGFFNKKYLDDAGFVSLAPKKSLDKGVYQLGIAIKNKAGQWTHQLTDRNIKVGSEYATVKAEKEALRTADIHWGVDKLQATGNAVTASGWAFFRGQHTPGSEIRLVLQNDTHTFSCATDPVLRPDVTTHFGKKFNLDHAGFNCKFLKDALPGGTYKVGIYIRNTQSGTEGMVLTDKEITH